MLFCTTYVRVSKSHDIATCHDRTRTLFLEQRHHALGYLSDPAPKSRRCMWIIVVNRCARHPTMQRRQHRIPAIVSSVVSTILILSLWNGAAVEGNPDPSSLSTPEGKNGFWSRLHPDKLFTNRRRNRRTKTDAQDGLGTTSSKNDIDSDRGSDDGDEEETETTTNMGQAMRMYRYDRDENEKNAIPALTIGGSGGASSSPPQPPLEWHRLDDGVMGGRSESLHRTDPTTGALRFAGTINTDGGGFCSVRSPIHGGLPEGTTGIRLRFRGDGKTYKLTLSDGTKSKFGPSRTGSWQHDIPTTRPRSSPEEEQKPGGDGGGDDDEDWETMVIPFSALESSFGPWAKTEAQKAIRFDVTSVRQIGFMLSLKLSDGSANPVETFGTGIFPFSLEILSIEPVLGTEPESS